MGKGMDRQDKSVSFIIELLVYPSFILSGIMGIAELINRKKGNEEK